MAYEVLGVNLKDNVDSFPEMNVRLGEYLKTLMNRGEKFFVDVGFYSKKIGTLYKSGDTDGYPLRLLIQFTGEELLITNSEWDRIVLEDLKDTYNIEITCEKLFGMNIHNIKDIFTRAALLLEVWYGNSKRDYGTWKVKFWIK